MPETVQGLIEQYVSEIKKIYGTMILLDISKTL